MTLSVVGMLGNTGRIMQSIVKSFNAPVLCRRAYHILCFAVLMAMLALPAMGQTDRDYDGPNMTYSYDGPRVTFEQIYADPTNRDLNLNYAQQQAARGDLLGAASALERLLYAEPNWHSVRLFYAGVLYRLDDKDAAAHEVMLLERQDLTPNQVTQLANYKSAFAYIPPVTAAAATGQNIADIKIKPAHLNIASNESKALPTARTAEGRGFDGRFSTGLRVDSNPGQLLADIVTGLPKHSDTSVFATGAIRATLPLSSAHNLYGFASANGQIRSYSDTPRADFSTAGFQVGIYSLIQDSRLAASFTADRVYIADEKYFTQTGPKFSVSTPINSTLELTATAEFYDQRFNSLSFAPLETLRSGSKQVFTADLSQTLSHGLVVHGGMGIEFKDAKIAELQYRGLRYHFGFDKTFDNGILADGRIIIRTLDYDNVGTAAPIFNRDSEDRLSSRFTIAAPLSYFAPNRDTKSDIYIEAGFNYDRRIYSDARTDFNNVGADVRLKWEF